ncbi:hypothetical protein DXG01_011790 [Tephrocybe rancida]|nr:hypothetical protein DXG01_011790 [Tephrocybe rancida]
MDTSLLPFSFLAIVSAQQVGILAKTHPKLLWYKPDLGQNLCLDGATCTANYALDSADYHGVHGVTTSSDALTLKFITKGANTNIGSHLYPLNSESKYELLKLLNQEFTFDVDVSNLPCGLNGALYFSRMDADGGVAKHSTNKAGAKYRTGYCDSWCPCNLKFIDGGANSFGWNGYSTDSNSGTGNYGACCNKMVIWGANKISAVYASHSYSVSGLSRCSDTVCGTSNYCGTVCDPNGCDFNSYRQGDMTFHGPGLKVDTTKKFTVVTQFISSDGTANGDLIEIHHLYVQNSVVIQNSKTIIPLWIHTTPSPKAAFGNTKQFQAKGGLTAMGKAAKNGMVLVLSVDNHTVNMLWLGATDASASTPGVGRGTCAHTSSTLTNVETNAPDSSITYSNICSGEIAST